MSGTELVPSLFGFTLIAVLVVAVAAFAYFMRKRGNRHPMDTPRGREIDEQHRRDAEEQR